MDPLPSPPLSELQNKLALDTITSYPHLFQIITPIRIQPLELILRTHPNRGLVTSVLRGFRTGFWPWARFDRRPDFPPTFDNSHRPLKEPAHLAFVHEQRDKEITKHRFSEAFGPELLPGMYSIPIGVVPKPHSELFRLVIDPSDGPYALNSIITREKVSVPLDNIRHLGTILRRARARYGPHVPLTLFKSDASEAYRNLPMDFLWQIRQVITIDNMRHIDRCNNFGWTSAGGLWGAFFGLVIWAAIHVRLIEDLLAYVDDSFGVDLEENMTLYVPYSKRLPTKQAKLLTLWDDVGIPHTEKKQVYGRRVTVIGFDVDSDAMTVTMPTTSRLDLISSIYEFAQPGQRRSLRDFQRLAGWMNWALNVYPRLKPGLSVMYAKMSKKTEPFRLIWVSVSLCRELHWFANHLRMSDGIFILDSSEWDVSSSDCIMYCDACPMGIAFWSPQYLCGFQHLVISGSDYDIWYLEALAVVSALHWVLTVSPYTPKRIVIYTDNTNTVDMFNSLRADPNHNPLLLTAIDLLISHGVELRVMHVPGEANAVADALSRFNNTSALVYAPGLQVNQFLPPRLTLGAPQL
ncbi:DNA/RNA polymerase [Athelia psychrophila]|uniref:DNA/RNA polymerase n=1 Tax=Athelia psychrophila TaxID=1759441 RepID=A0A166HTD7_9AGAM|nr:DNA/RNA polymerase [Fibularhizoctonia sp. CBS 109695]